MAGAPPGAAVMAGVRPRSRDGWRELTKEATKARRMRAASQLLHTASFHIHTLYIFRTNAFQDVEVHLINPFFIFYIFYILIFLYVLYFLYSLYCEIWHSRI